MTLHLAISCSLYLVSVGDRLLTTPLGPHRREWDPYSNKTILVLADNGVVSVSYAGLAHIGHEPTDQWLMRVISEKTPRSLTGDGSFGVYIGPVTVQLGPMLDRISKAVDRDFLRLSSDRRRNGLEIMIEGFTWTRKAKLGHGRVRTYSAQLNHAGVRSQPVRWQHYESTAVGYRPRGYSFAAIGATDPGSNERVRREAEATVREGKVFGPAEAERALAAEVRAMAKPGSGIGKELMSLRIEWPGPAIRVRYLRTPGSGHFAFGAGLIASGGKRGTGMISYPTLLTGPNGSSVQLGQLNIPFEVDPPFPSSGSFGMYANPRRPLS